MDLFDSPQFHNGGSCHEESDSKSNEEAQSSGWLGNLKKQFKEKPINIRISLSS